MLNPERGKAMQLSYHAYHFVDDVTKERYRADIRQFISGFVGWKNSKFKNEFSHGGESIFLLPGAGSVYHFIQARDREIIKRIERATMSATEIRAALGDNDSVGFASFVYLQDDHLAIGSTVLAPRMTAFTNYVNALLQKLDIGLDFETTAMTHTLPKSELQRLSHVGQFSLKVRSQNRLFDSFCASLGGNNRDDFDIGSIEITVRPLKKRADNQRALKAVIETIGDDGLESFDARAKIDTADRMADVFIVGAGGIRDPIKTDDEATIIPQIIRAAENNSVLRDRLNEFRQDSNISSVDDPSDLGLAWPPPSVAALGTD
jgi:hypothetical protein